MKRCDLDTKLGGKDNLLFSGVSGVSGGGEVVEVVVFELLEAEVIEPVL